MRGEIETGGDPCIWHRAHCLHCGKKSTRWGSHERAVCWLAEHVCEFEAEAEHLDVAPPRRLTLVRSDPGV